MVAIVFKTVYTTLLNIGLQSQHTFRLYTTYSISYMIHTEYTKYYDTAYHRYRIYILLQYSVLYIQTILGTYVQYSVSCIQTIQHIYKTVYHTYRLYQVHMYNQGFHSQNFCAIFAERNAKFFFLCASVLREKKTICAIIRKSHFAKNYPFPLLRNSSFAQFRNFVKLKRLVTVCVSQNSILDKSCFGMSSYNWSLLHN